MTPTKARILDSAERLFAEKGYASTSVREVISDAAVNLAAVHYHFHSKQALLDAVVERRCIGLNRDRLDMLARFEREADGRPVELEQIFEAFLIPAFRMARKPLSEIRYLCKIRLADSVSKSVFQGSVIFSRANLALISRRENQMQ